jgi:hypothetical protein
MRVTACARPWSAPPRAVSELSGAVAPYLREDFRSLVDAADRIRQAVSTGNCRRGRSERGRHERDRRVEAQERDTQEAGPDRRLNEPSLG